MTAVDEPSGAPHGGARRPARGGRMTRRGRWVVAGVAVTVALSAAFDIGHGGGTRGRAGDLTALVATINTDIAACNSSLRDSYSAYAEVVGGRNDERATAESIIAGDEPNCTPARQQRPVRPGHHRGTGDPPGL